MIRTFFAALILLMLGMTARMLTTLLKRRCTRCEE